MQSCSTARAQFTTGSTLGALDDVVGFFLDCMADVWEVRDDDVAVAEKNFGDDELPPESPDVDQAIDKESFFSFGILVADVRELRDDVAATEKNFGDEELPPESVVDQAMDEELFSSLGVRVAEGRELRADDVAEAEKNFGDGVLLPSVEVVDQPTVGKLLFISLGVRVARFFHRTPLETGVLAAAAFLKLL